MNHGLNSMVKAIAKSTPRKAIEDSRPPTSPWWRRWLVSKAQAPVPPRADTIAVARQPASVHAVYELGNEGSGAQRRTNRLRRRYIE